MFANFRDTNLQKRETEQVLQVLQISLAVAADVKKGTRERKFFYILFHDIQSSVALVILVKFLQIALNSSRSSTVAMSDSKTSSVL